MEKTFIRVRSGKDIIISASLIILGSVLVALPTGTGVNITGFFMIFAGLITALILKTAYKDSETGLKYKKTEHYFQQAMNSVISSALKTAPGSIDLTETDKKNAVRLDIYHSKSEGKAYLQLFEYVPYKYEPCSAVYEYEIDKVGKLL